MRIIIPMGGSGKRFQYAGYTLPKPLLPLGEKRLVQLAIASTAQLAGDYHFIVSCELAKHPLIMDVLPPSSWHVLMHETPGPLQTVLAFPGCVEVEEELLFMDCDSFLNTSELRQAVETFRASGATGGVTVRTTTDPICSFAKIDEEWWVQETREKDPFTMWSTTGPYWFRSGLAFWHAAQKASKAHHISLSPVYNYLEGKTKAVPVSTFQHLGTPDAYEAAKQEVERWPQSMGISLQ